MGYSPQFYKPGKNICGAEKENRKLCNVCAEFALRQIFLYNSKSAESISAVASRKREDAMPEGYTHIRTAKRAAQEIHYKLHCPAAFAAGANGPDAFFSFEAWKRPHRRRQDLPLLGRRMHGEKTGAFLCSLVAHADTRAQVEYALGFLCHYGVDTMVHPYVAAMCQPGMPYAQKGGHAYFEIALDSMLHAEDTGISDVPADDSAPELLGEPLGDVCALLHAALLETYGEDVPAEYLADAFDDLHRVRSLMVSRHHFRYVLYWLIEPIFGGRGALTGHVSPRRLVSSLPDPWKDPYTGTEYGGNIMVLLAAAQKRCSLLMLATLEFWMRKLTWEELKGRIGSLSYLTGQPEAVDPEKMEPPKGAGPQEAAAPKRQQSK